jgi:protein ImuB
VARDYFIAADSSERLYWIFRERPNGGWFLQGLFG